MFDCISILSKTKAFLDGIILYICLYIIPHNNVACWGVGKEIEQKSINARRIFKKARS